MDSKLQPNSMWIGLALGALGLIGLMAQLHAQRAGTVPAAMRSTTKAVLPAVLEASAGAATPAPNRLHHRRSALSMPYFSFARLLRPGS